LSSPGEIEDLLREYDASWDEAMQLEGRSRLRAPAICPLPNDDAVPEPYDPATPEGASFLRALEPDPDWARVEQFA